MKKGTKKAPANKKAPEQAYVKFLPVLDVLSKAAETENKVVFDLTAHDGRPPEVTLTIYPSDRDFDNAIINVFGFSIRVIIRAGKTGMFVSFPSQKGKDGKYYDIVTCYDKDFHALMKELLSSYYNDEESANE